MENCKEEKKYSYFIVVGVCECGVQHKKIHNTKMIIKKSIWHKVLGGKGPSKEIK
jgi:hypothetical protein